MDEEKISIGGITYSDNDKGNKMHSAKDGKFTGKGEAKDSTIEAPEEEKPGLLSILAKIQKQVEASDGEESFLQKLSKYKSEERNIIDTLERIKENEREIITLQHFSEHSKRKRESMEVSRDSQYDPELLEAIKKAWDRCYEKSTPCHMIWFGKLYNLFDKDGHYFNLFEAQANGKNGEGCTYAPVRIRATYNLFGTLLPDGSQIPEHWGDDFRSYSREKERKVLFSLEKYGFMGDKTPWTYDNGRASQYGDCIIKLRKERVESRTTYTIGDSLNTGGMPQYAALGFSSATICGNFYPEAPVMKDLDLAESMRDFLRAMQNNPKYHRYLHSYIETQVHGDVTLDDIQSVVLPSWSHFDVNKMKRILQVAQEHNIDIYGVADEEIDAPAKRIYLENGIIKYEDVKEEKK